MRKAILSFALLSVLAVLHVNAAADCHPSLDTLYVLGGELSNSAATSINDIDEVMPRMAAIGLNTVLVPAYWEFIEPVEGQFDFTLVDRVIGCRWFSCGLAPGRTPCRAMPPCGSNKTQSASPVL